MLIPSIHLSVDQLHNACIPFPPREEIREKGCCPIRRLSRSSSARLLSAPSSHNFIRQAVDAFTLYPLHECSEDISQLKAQSQSLSPIIFVLPDSMSIGCDLCSGWTTLRVPSISWEQRFPRQHPSSSPIWRFWPS